MDKLLGPSWKTSLIGLLGGIVAYFVQLGPNLPTNGKEWGQAAVSALVFAFGAVAKDHNVSNSPTPSVAAVVPTDKAP